MKSKVYIETPNVGDLTVNGVPCVKLGELKSGEFKTFEISDNAAKVFVICDSVSKDYCNDFYQLSEGNEDVTLTGRHKFNLANGNAFVFDNNDNPEALENRKRGKRKGSLWLILAIVIGVFVGLGIGIMSALH